MSENEKIALFDLDGTLADLDFKMSEDYKKIMAPGESHYSKYKRNEEPEYIQNRKRLIRSQPRWWENLPEFKLGFDVLKIAKKLGFKIHILTKGPSSTPYAWTEKTIWVKKKIKSIIPDAEITITEDKGLVYGTILVDDYPEYIKRWLEHRPRGLVIMPAHSWNKEYKHQNVIRYDGTNLKEVKQAMIKAKNRAQKV
jgi:FMN phosphatase YigB (HAD superfamily)